MSVTMLAMESRNAPLCPSSSASKWPSMYLRLTPAGSVVRYQKKDATKYLNKCRSRSVSTFLSKTAAMFLCRVLLLFLSRNVKLSQEDIVSLFLSRGQGWSHRMYLERSVLLLVVGEVEEQGDLEELVEQEVLEDLEVRMV